MTTTDSNSGIERVDPQERDLWQRIEKAATLRQPVLFSGDELRAIYDLKCQIDVLRSEVRANAAHGGRGART